LLTDWQARRERINHDGLTPFAGSLARLRNTLPVRPADEVKRRIRELQDSWRLLEIEILSIIADFEREMSPSGLLLQVPLSNLTLSDREWLSPLINALWLARRSPSRLSSEAFEAVLRASELGNSLGTWIEPDGLGTEHLSAHLPNAVLEWHGRCIRVCEAIGQFPSEIEAV
jgi:hypothetical protein